MTDLIDTDGAEHLESLDWLTDPDDPAPSLAPIDEIAEEIDALGLATWHGRQLGRVRAEIAELDELHRRELARVREWYEGRRVVLERREARHLGPIRALHALIIRRNPKRKTIGLASCTMRATVPKTPRIKADDPEVFIEWALENAGYELVRTKYEPDLVAIKAALLVAVDDEGQPTGPVITSTGEQVPGLSGVLAPPTFTVETGKS